MGLEKIGTTLGKEIIACTRTKPKTWQNLVKTELKPADLAELGIKYPKDTTKVAMFLGEKQNGSITKFFTFKGKKGENLGSLSLFPDGRKLGININRAVNDMSYLSSTPKAIEIDDVYDASRKLITRGEFLGKSLLEKRSRFIEIFKPKNLIDVDKTYVSTITTSKKPLQDGQTRFGQNIMQIETGKTPLRISFSSQSKMNSEGDMILESFTQNGVNMDTTNPYFQTLLMEPRDMIRAVYADIVKKRNLKGIEPPLYCGKEVFNGKYAKVGGNAPEDNSYIGVNLLLPYLSKLTLANTVAHECEHLFTQHANIYLAGLKDMRSDNKFSKKFFDGLAKRFKPIKKGTKEYQNAKIYLKELENYENKVFTEDLKVNNEVWKSLNVEKDAITAGQKEEKTITDCLNNFIENFNLFNQPYVTTWRK